MNYVSQLAAKIELMLIRPWWQMLHKVIFSKLSHTAGRNAKVKGSSLPGWQHLVEGHLPIHPRTAGTACLQQQPAFAHCLPSPPERNCIGIPFVGVAVCFSCEILQTFQLSFVPRARPCRQIRTLL